MHKAKIFSALFAWWFIALTQGNPMNGQDIVSSIGPFPNMNTCYSMRTWTEKNAKFAGKTLQISDCWSDKGR